MLSDEIRQAISDSGMTQTELAKAADVAGSVLSRFTRGQQGITLETADRIVRALGLRVAFSKRRRKARQ